HQVARLCREQSGAWVCARGYDLVDAQSQPLVLEGHPARATTDVGHPAIVPDARARSASWRSAAGKTAAGGVTRPAPTWPVPAHRPAIPVLICGRMPVRTTLVTSIPHGHPRKSNSGTVNTGCSPRVISYMRFVVVIA